MKRPSSRHEPIGSKHLLKAARSRGVWLSADLSLGGGVEGGAQETRDLLTKMPYPRCRLYQSRAQKGRKEDKAKAAQVNMYRKLCRRSQATSHAMFVPAAHIASGA